MYYADGYRNSARAIARLLSIDQVEPLDAETRGAWRRGPTSSCWPGADQAP